MKVVLASLGTAGDVYPYIGLGKVLVERGDQVVLLADETYEGLARSEGLGFRRLLSKAEIDELLDNPDFWHAFKAGPLAAKWGGQFIERQFHEFAEETSSKDSILVASPGLLAARLVQEKLHKPLATLVLQPWMIPSSKSPPVMPGGLTLPAWAPAPFKAIYWSIFHRTCDQLICPYLNPICASLGLGPIRKSMCWWLSPELVIGLFPRAYAEAQTDWPLQLKHAGFPVYDGSRTGKLSPEVEGFLARGEKPVVVTMGTGMRFARRHFADCISALEQLGKRGIFLTKLREQMPPNLPNSVHWSPYEPLGRLLPECSAIVHHGGMGTLSRALRSGVPQLVLPFAFDQFENGARVRRLGAGDVLPAVRAHPKRIAAALDRLLLPSTLERAAAAGRVFNGTNGLELAADLVEELARSRNVLQRPSRHGVDRRSSGRDNSTDPSLPKKS